MSTTDPHYLVTHHLDGLRRIDSQVPGDDTEADELQSSRDGHVAALRLLLDRPDVSHTDRGLIRSALQPASASDMSGGFGYGAQVPG